MDLLGLVRKNQFTTSSIAVERSDLVDHIPNELIFYHKLHRNMWLCNESLTLFSLRKATVSRNAFGDTVSKMPSMTSTWLTDWLCNEHDSTRFRMS